MHCLISVVLSQWSAIYAEAQNEKRRLLEVASGVALPRPPIFNSVSGFLLLVDWDETRVLGGITLPKPTGFLIEKECLQVALWDRDEIAEIRGASVVSRFRHPFFNHIHTLDRTPNGLLLSSSGTDLLVEVDEAGKILWEYFLFEHGYDKRFRLGQSFSRTEDYNRRYLPAALSTHPNSAILVDEHTVLATLFSTGELVRIDRPSGRVDVVLSGLKRPHSIRRRAAGGYSLCDTEASTVVLIDHALNVERRLPVPAPWLQDAVFAQERLFTVGNRRIHLNPLQAEQQTAEMDNYVLELRDGDPFRKLSLGPDNRIYMVEPIAPDAAESLAAAWRDNPLELSGLRWESACT